MKRVEISGFFVTTDVVGGVVLFEASKGKKFWAEWYDARRNRVECIDTARPDTLENIEDEEDVLLETEINKLLKKIALDINAPAMVPDSEGNYLGYEADSREEAAPMVDAVIKYFECEEK